MESRRRPVVLESRLGNRPAGADEAREPRLSGGAVLEPLECARVPGDVRGEPRVNAEDHQHGDERDRPAERPANGRRVDPHGPESEAPARSDRQREQHDARAERVGERDRDGLRREAAHGGERRDRCDDGPRARREEESEAQPEQESAAHVAGPPPAEREKRPLEQLAESRPREGESDQEDDGDRDVAEEVAWQPECAEQGGGRKRERGEAEDEAGDDCVRAAL